MHFTCIVVTHNSKTLPTDVKIHFLLNQYGHVFHGIHNFPNGESALQTHAYIWCIVLFVSSVQVGIILLKTLTTKTIFMNSILYVIAVILIIGWALGFFMYSAGGVIHILLVLAIIAILVNVIRGRAL